jgi:5-methylcytosine-specific restriction endonuclease McrA
MMARDDINFDHIIPKSRGGGGEIENLKLAHKRCNTERGNSMDGVLFQCDGITAMKYEASR